MLTQPLALALLAACWSPPAPPPADTAPDSAQPQDTAPPADTAPAQDTAPPTDTAPDTGPRGQVRAAHDVSSSTVFSYVYDWSPFLIDQFKDGRLLLSGHASSNEFCPGGLANIHSGDGELLTGVFVLEPGEFDSQCTAFGDRSYIIGDVDGDGLEDIVLTAARTPVSFELVGDAALAFGADFPGSQYVTYPNDNVPLLTGVGLTFTRCDINQDGLADLCSALGVAVGPPPFTQPYPFAEAQRDNLVQWASVEGQPGLILWQADVQRLAFIPATKLPSQRPIDARLTTERPITGAIRALHIADVYPTPGPELLAVIVEDGVVTLSAFDLRPGFPLLDSWVADTPEYPENNGTGLTTSDFNSDGHTDIAFTAGSLLYVLAGPFTHNSWAVTWRGSQNSDFGTALTPQAPAGTALFVGEPTRRRLHLLQDPLTTALP